MVAETKGILSSSRSASLAKTEMLSHLTDDGLVVLCADDDMLLELKREIGRLVIFLD